MTLTNAPLYVIPIIALLIFSITTDDADAASDQYKKGYKEGYNTNKPAPSEIDNDFQLGFDHGRNDKDNKKHPKYSIDWDPGVKGGGKDPLVFGDWWYHENSGAECKSNSPFDYDNDGFKEDFCYVIVGDIFVVDFGSGIKSGYNLLNFDRTAFEGMSPVEYLQAFPDTCKLSDCYLWKDSTSDWVAEPSELTPFSFEIESLVNYPDGIRKGEFPAQGMDPDSNGRYRYCEGTTTEGLDFYCLQPTYWMKGI